MTERFISGLFSFDFEIERKGFFFIGKGFDSIMLSGCQDLTGRLKSACVIVPWNCTSHAGPAIYTQQEIKL